MPVFNVAVESAETGNKRSQTLVADASADALETFAAVRDLNPDDPTLRFTVRAVEDLDGSSERALKDAEQRRAEHLSYRMPAKKMPWHGNRRRR